MSSAPRRKRITRLVPPEEELAPIEELTDRSEDSSCISEKYMSPLSYRPSGLPSRIKESAATAFEHSNGNSDTQRRRTPKATHAKAFDTGSSASMTPPSRSNGPLPANTTATRPLSSPDAAVPIGASHQNEPSPDIKMKLSTPSGSIAALHPGQTVENDPIRRKADERGSPTASSCPTASTSDYVHKIKATANSGKVSATGLQRTEATLADIPEEISSSSSRSNYANSHIIRPKALQGEDSTSAGSAQSVTFISMENKHETDASQTDFSTETSLQELGDSTVLSVTHSGSDESDTMIEFDDDFEDHTVSEDRDERLTWRLDPSLSLSDWAITIRSKKRGSTQTYYVHKSILAIGPRKSLYFVKAFRNIAKVSMQQKSAWPVSCEIELEDVGAKTFPAFLDYIYSQDGTLEITTESATGLRYLSIFFGVRTLHKRVLKFIQKDLTLATMTVYYKYFHLTKDEKLLTYAAKYCAKNIMKIDPNFPSLKYWDSSFCMTILQSSYINSQAKRLHISLILAENCRLRKGKLHASDFAMLTDESVLPVIHYKAALTFMELECDIIVATSLENMLGVSNLQQRCIKDLATHWKKLCSMDEALVAKVCRKLPCGVVTELMMKSLLHAKQETRSSLTVESSNHGSVKLAVEETSEMTKEYEAKLEELQKQHEQQMESLMKETEATVHMARQLIAQKETQLASHIQELQSFERLPNSYEGKLMPTDKLHGPSLLPELHADEAEGMLLATKQGGPNYPLFYYKPDGPKSNDHNGENKKE